MFGKSLSALLKPMSRSESAGWPARPRVYQTVPEPPICLNSHSAPSCGVLDLVVVQVPRVRVGDVGVNRDGHDARRVGLGERRVERVGVVRVEHDRVDLLRDQRAQSDSCPAASVLRWMTVIGLEILVDPERGAPRPWRCRPAPRGSRCRRRRRSSIRSRTGRLYSRRCGRRARARTGGRDQRDRRKADEQPRLTGTLDHSFSSSCLQRARMVASTSLVLSPVCGSMRSIGHTSCVVPAAITPPG